MEDIIQGVGLTFPFISYTDCQAMMVDELMDWYLRAVDYREREHQAVEEMKNKRRT